MQSADTSLSARVLNRLTGVGRQAVKGVVNLALPHVCPLCRAHEVEEPAFLCAACEEDIEPLATPRCPACGGAVDGMLDQCGECLQLGGRPWSHAVSAFAFGGRVRRAIHRLKYGRHAYVAPWLGHCMAENWREHGRQRPDAVVPVPLHWMRQYRRGFNQAELLACTVAASLQVPLVRALRRSRRTVQQATLDARARQLNLSDVFTLRAPERIADRHVLVVDDVLTTGATLAHTTRVINDAGPATVSVLTAARG